MSLGKDTHLCAPRPRRGRREGCVPVKGLCACAVSVAPRQPRSSRLSPCASLGLPRAVGVGFPVHPGLFLFAAQRSSVAWVTPFDLSLLRTLWVPPSFWVLRMELLQAAVHTSLQARFLSFLAEVCSAHSALFLVCSQWSGLGVSCRSVAGGAGARLRRAGSGGAAGPWPLALSCASHWGWFMSPCTFAPRGRHHLVPPSCPPPAAGLFSVSVSLDCYVFVFEIPHVSGISRALSFSVWPASLSRAPCRPICSVAENTVPFSLWPTGAQLCATDDLFLTHSPTSGHSGCVCVLAVVVDI